MELEKWFLRCEDVFTVHACSFKFHSLDAGAAKRNTYEVFVSNIIKVEESIMNRVNVQKSGRRIRIKEENIYPLYKSTFYTLYDTRV